MLSLPEDMIYEIISHLSIIDRIHFLQVLKRPIQSQANSTWWKTLDYTIEITEPLYDNGFVFKLDEKEKLIMTYTCSDEYAILITTLDNQFLVYEFVNDYYRPDDESEDSKEYHRERNTDQLEYQDCNVYTKLNDVRFYYVYNQYRYDIKPYDVLKYL